MGKDPHTGTCIHGSVTVQQTNTYCYITLLLGRHSWKTKKYLKAHERLSHDEMMITANLHNTQRILQSDLAGNVACSKVVLWSACKCLFFNILLSVKSELCTLLVEMLHTYIYNYNQYCWPASPQSGTMSATAWQLLTYSGGAPKIRMKRFVETMP